MPRLFDSRRHAYTYAVLMSAAMSAVMTVSINIIDHGFTAAALRSIAWHYPFAFGINLVAALVLSPLIRALTVRVWAGRR